MCVRVRERERASKRETEEEGAMLKEQGQERRGHDRVTSFSLKLFLSSSVGGIFGVSLALSGNVPASLSAQGIPGCVLRPHSQGKLLPPALPLPHQVLGGLWPGTEPTSAPKQVRACPLGSGVPPVQSPQDQESYEAGGHGFFTVTSSAPGT